MITLHDVARHAKVSVSAVSAAVRGSDGRQGTRLSPKTRQRILEVAQELGYRPNVMARGLAGGRTNMVGLLWSLGGLHNSVMISRLGMMLQDKHYAWTIADHRHEQRLAHAALVDFARRGVDAVVVNDAFPAMLREPRVRQLLESIGSVVMVSADELNVAGDLLVVDRLTAVRQIVDHFVASGRRRPAMLAPLEGNRSKWECFDSRLREHGLEPIEAAAIDMGRHSSMDYRPLTHQTLDGYFGKRIPFDALWCTTDQTATAAISWLNARGLRVPDDVAVVGFNNDPLAPYVAPPLASVDRCADATFDWIEKRLFQCLAKPNSAPVHQRLGMEFIWRESAGGPPPGRGNVAGD
jgi:DNA-binding LacI/PurR family transcriptional regulator